MTRFCVKMIKKIVTKAITTRNVKLESVQFYYKAPERDLKDPKKVN